MTYPSPPLTAAEVDILSLATQDTRKFGIELGLILEKDAQLALESLQLANRVRLIDVSPASNITGPMFRLFMVTPAGEFALAVFRKQIAN